MRIYTPPRMIFYHHLGLGDHFICFGLVRQMLLSTCDEIWLPCKTANLPTVRHLYSELPEVKIMEMPAHVDRMQESLSLVNLSISKNVPLLMVNYNGDPEHYFDHSFYEQMGLDFYDSWDLFRMPDNHDQSQELFDKLVGSDSEAYEHGYALVHDTGSVGKFNLDLQTELPIIRFETGHTESLLNWRTIIEMANEIHCIDSSVIHLVDRLSLGADRLVYHDVGRGSKFHLQNHWETKTYK